MRANLKVCTISVVPSSPLLSLPHVLYVHEVGRELGVLANSVVFITVHEVEREQGVLTISVVCTVHEVEREQGVIAIRSMCYATDTYTIQDLLILLLDLAASERRNSCGCTGSGRCIVQL